MLWSFLRKQQLKGCKFRRQTPLGCFIVDFICFEAKLIIEVDGRDHMDKIRLVFLPSYSPNLNPIERLWKFFKKMVLYNTYYENVNAFREACIDFFKNIDDYMGELSSLLHGDFEQA